MEKWFTLNIRPDVLRGMNRAEYKEASRRLRLCQNAIMKRLDKAIVAEKILHFMLYGSFDN